MDSSQIEELAGQWLARRDSAGWSETDETEFQSWLEQSTANVVAFVRLEAAWTQAKRLKALSAGVPAGQVPSPEDWQITPLVDKAASVEEPARRSADAGLRAGRLKLLLGVAASALLAVAIVTWRVWPAAPDYSTPIGGLASVPISDGSKVTLNTDSQIRVAVSDDERRIELRQGEAFFEVAKDSTRPFVVTVGRKRVIAVGTAFSVRRDGGDVRVVITEGRVRFEDEAQSPARGGEALTLDAGSIARATDAGVLVQEKPIAELESELSWRSGYLVFRDVVLADAIAEFNRYNIRKIGIDDPAVAAIRVSGKFRSTQVEAFVRLLEQGFAVRARSVDAHIVLTDARSTAP